MRTQTWFWLWRTFYNTAGKGAGDGSFQAQVHVQAMTVPAACQTLISQAGKAYCACSLSQEGRKTVDSLADP